MKRQGFTFIEVLLALLIVAFGLGPILLFYRQGTKVAHFNEGHLLARHRGRRILENLAALDYESLRRLAGSATYPPTMIPGLPSLQGLPTLLPELTNELPVMADKIPLPPHVAHFQQKLSRYEEAVFWEELSPDGFARIIVYIGWKQPGEGPADKVHVYRHVRFVSRAERSLFYRPPLGGV